jgi:hypothetical protein
MPLVILNHLLDVFVQLANERGFTKKKNSFVGTSHMSNNRHMSVAMQRLVDFISMVMQQYCNALLAGFSVVRSICNSPLLCNG